MKVHPCQVAGLKCARESDEANLNTPAPASGKMVLQVHIHSGFKCLWLLEWVGKVLKCLIVWSVQNRLSSYVSLIELHFWKRLKIEILNYAPWGLQA